jgi:hypothetical protein
LPGLASPAGTVVIQSIAWTLCGMIRGSRSFGAPAPDIDQSEDKLLPWSPHMI